MKLCDFRDETIRGCNRNDQVDLVPFCYLISRIELVVNKQQQIQKFCREDVVFQGF